MPKITALQDPAVVELVAKKVAQAESAAAKSAQRQYKLFMRTMKEALNTANLDKKIVKGLTAHLVTAVSAHEPSAQATE